MSWKIFKKQISSMDFNDETKFILGIDIGSKATKIAIWNVNRKQAELIDMSGGYGNPSIPTVMQYIPENREWVYGEYALLNRGYFDDITIHNILSKLGTKELIDISGKPMNIPNLLSRYIKEIIDMCKNLNPNADIVGVIAAVPDYFSESAREELERAFSIAGLSKALINLMGYRECILRYLYFERSLNSEEKVLFIDYGGEQIRGGLIRVNPSNEGSVNAETLSYLFDSTLGGRKLDKLLKKLFVNFYCEETGLTQHRISDEILHQIEVFAYQNKGLLFQNYYKKKTTKLYFNFVYPAFQKSVTIEDMDRLIEPFSQSIKEFISKLLNKTINGVIDKNEIHKIIAVGGGFEMSWMKELLENEFLGSSIIYPKEAEGTVALGACIGAASYLGIIPETMIKLTDYHRLTWDIGINGAFRKAPCFIPLIEKNTFWWQKPKPKIFILDGETENTLCIPVYKRNDRGEITPLHTINLEGLPDRPSRTLRLKFTLGFRQYDQIEVIIKDCGFGEMFPATDYTQTAIIQL